MNGMQVASAVPDVRVRFTSPHPKDFPDEVLEAIAAFPNICRQLHLPAQSGNSDVLVHRNRKDKKKVQVLNPSSKFRNCQKVFWKGQPFENHEPLFSLISIG